MAPLCSFWPSWGELTSSSVAPLVTLTERMETRVEMAGVEHKHISIQHQPSRTVETVWGSALVLMWNSCVPVTAPTQLKHVCIFVRHSGPEGHGQSSGLATKHLSKG